MAQNGQAAQITPILWSSYYPNFEPILVSQPCLGEQVLLLRDRNSRPLSGSQTTSSSSSTWRRCPRPNGCHFYKYVFNRFFFGVHLHALHKLNGRAIAQFLHLPAWKWFQLGQLGLQQRSTWTCLVAWQFHYCQVEWVLVAIPPGRQI